MQTEEAGRDQRAGGEFDADTAVVEIGDGLFHGAVTDRWHTLIGPDGGYVMAIAAQALAKTLPHPHPFTSTAHFVRKAEVGPVEMEVQTIRSGRRHSTGQVTMTQAGKEVLRLLGTFGDLEAVSGPSFDITPPPLLPPPEECEDPWAHPPFKDSISIGKRVDVRLAQLPGWMTGNPSGIARFEYYQRFADGREADPLSMVFFADAAPPAIFELDQMASITLELTVHSRAVAAPGWLTLLKEAAHVKDGYFQEDVTIWDSAGAVVGSSRQMGLII